MKPLASLLCLTACGGAAPTPTNPAPATVELTWVVYPVDPALVDDQHGPLAPLELRVNGQPLKLDAQMGVLNATYQGVCHEPDKDYAYPMRVDEVAKITFEEGGAGG